MNMTALLFLVIVIILGLALARTRRRVCKFPDLSWDELIAKLEPVPIAEISAIALDYLHPHKNQVQLDTDKLWGMIGQADGLSKMYANAQVLVALAGYAQRWNRDESVIVTERVRRDAVALRRAVFTVSLGLTLGYDRLRVPFSVQEAASAYYLMRSRVLALYETSHAGRFPRLAAAL